MTAYDCKDVTASSNFAAFADWTSEFGNMTNMFNASLLPQASDLTIQLSVQTCDMKRSLYQAVNCTGVSRSYSVTIAHNTSSTIDVRDSRLLLAGFFPSLASTSCSLPGMATHRRRDANAAGSDRY